MAKKSKASRVHLEDPEAEALRALLIEMESQGLPVQQGGFQVNVIPTGIASFDVSTGVGGVPRRRISLFVGKEGSGKTLLLLSLIASAQRAGGRAAFIDAEHALTPDFARLLGVDFDAMVVSRPNTLEQCYDIAKKFASSGLFDVVGFDSAVALATEQDLMLSASESTTRAGQAQVHSDELKKLTSLCHDRTAFVMTNQVRVDPNPPKWWTQGPRYYHPGGNAISFYASLRVELSTRDTFKNSAGIRVGHRIQSHITKNKVAIPFRKAQFDINYEIGIDSILDMINTALSLGVIYKNGSWFYFDVLGDDSEVLEEMKWLGRDKVDAAIRGDEKLKKAILSRLASDHIPEQPAEANGWDDVE